MRLDVEFLQRPLVAFWAAFLPDPERSELARRHEINTINVPRWSFGIGLIQLFGGTLLLFLGDMAYMTGQIDDESMFLIEHWRAGLSTLDFQAVGLLNWLAYFLYPVAWLLLYVAFSGLARCVAFAGTREAVGDPVVWLLLRTSDLLRARRAGRRLERAMGPPRPDRMLRDERDGSEIVVLTCREKPEWTPAVTIQIDDRHYALREVVPRRDGEWVSLEYRMRELRPGEIIRSLVRYDPPRV